MPGTPKVTKERRWSGVAGPRRWTGCYRCQRRSRRPHPSRPPLLLSWRGRLRLLHPLSLPRHTPQISPLPSKDRGTRCRYCEGGRAEHQIRNASPPLHSPSKRTPVPETRPTTIEGWMLREVTNGTAVLEGPNGIWRVKRGDTVPGGRVESMFSGASGG